MHIQSTQTYTYQQERRRVHIHVHSHIHVHVHSHAYITLWCVALRYATHCGAVHCIAISLKTIHPTTRQPMYMYAHAYTLRSASFYYGFLHVHFSSTTFLSFLCSSAHALLYCVLHSYSCLFYIAILVYR